MTAMRLRASENAGVHLDVMMNFTVLVVLYCVNLMFHDRHDHN